MTFSLFTPFPNLLATISAKEDGPMRAKNQLENHFLKTRNTFLLQHGVTPDQVVSAELVHGNTIYTVTKKDYGKVIPHTDGLITNEKNVFLAVTIADCLPIFFYDPIKEVVGLIHAGWRGLEKKIINQIIKTFTKNYESTPENILAFLGPGIGVCHFEAQADLLLVFKDYPQAAEERERKHFINLKEIAKEQLLTLGILEKNIEISPLCTFCEKDTYFSHRRGRMYPEEVMIAIIGMR